jgi:hypothetical protein
MASSRALTASTVHIKLFPTPRSFPEHREVLRVLERFGEVATFRSLKVGFQHLNCNPKIDSKQYPQYEPRQKVPNAFIALFTTESAAKDLINASPIRYSLLAEAPPLDPSSEPFFSEVVPNPELKDVDGSDTKPTQEEKFFELNASVSTFDHIKYLTAPSSNPLHGPFAPIDARRSYIAMSLGKVIPNSLWSKGLKDWETANLKWRDIGVETTEGGSGEEASLEYQFAMRERKRKEETRPRVMRGLTKLVEERERLEAEKQVLDEKMKMQESAHGGEGVGRIVAKSTSE